MLLSEVLIVFNYLVKLAVFSFHCIGTYIPKKEVEVMETIRATIIQPNQAIRLRARKETRVNPYVINIMIS